MCNIIGYLRVSTKQQGDSALGLEGQRASIEAYAKVRNAKVSHWYTEIESGKRDDNRPQLHKALAHAKRSKDILCVAKLDRLSRNVKFMATILESPVEFACADMPSANRLTLHILSAVAEAEAKMISERTKTALKALKARGIKLGSARPGHWDGREELRLAGLAKGRSRSGKKLRSDFIAAYTDILPLMRELRTSGASLRAIAQRLNDDGMTMRQGGQWRPTQVKRVLEKMAAMESKAASG